MKLTKEAPIALIHVSGHFVRVLSSFLISCIRIAFEMYKQYLLLQ